MGVLRERRTVLRTFAKEAWWTRCTGKVSKNTNSWTLLLCLVQLFPNGMIRTAHGTGGGKIAGRWGRRDMGVAVRKWDLGKPPNVTEAHNIPFRRKNRPGG